MCVTEPNVERRRAWRARPGPLRVQLSPSSLGTLVDISTTGALIRLEDKPDVNAEVTVHLEWERTTIQLRGRVVRTARAHAGGRMLWTDSTVYEVAIQFGSVSDDASALLKRLTAEPSPP
jgi:hypothetical protein